MKNWLDDLNKDDPIIRRLEMIRLLRSGTPVEAIAREYNAVPEYISRLEEEFFRSGVPGILTEEDFQRFRTIRPEVIRVCTFNLHGTHNSDPLRLKRIALELAPLDPDLCAFQEVICGNGIEDTGKQLSDLMSQITGSYYRTSFALCHLFMEKYPEGISVASRYPLKNSQKIDLNRGLAKGLVPNMDRYASVAEIEIYGRKVVFASVHLDYDGNSEVRLAQAKKLLKELDRLYAGNAYNCFILAGDFNDAEDSPVMEFLIKNGYKDAYRQCHSTGGNTYSTSNPHARIDYIMVKGLVDFISADLVLKGPELSDHIGVFAVIR